MARDRSRHRYNSFADRVLASLSEVEREDVRAFDRWFYSTGGWRWLFVIVGVTTAIAWVASRLPWNMSFVEAAILFNLVVLMLIWAGLSAWFGYRQLPGQDLPLRRRRAAVRARGRVRRRGHRGARARASTRSRGCRTARSSATSSTAGLVFGFLYALVVALIAHLRNREYAALTAQPRGRGAPERAVAPARRVAPEAAAGAGRAALPLQHARQRAAARREARARRGEADRRPDRVPARGERRRCATIADDACGPRPSWCAPTCRSCARAWARGSTSR